MRTAVIVPARDEAPRIGAVIDRLRAALPEARILVVLAPADGATARAAESAGAEVIIQRAGGYPGAVAAGLRAAAERGADRAVLLDADGQHPPEEAPRLLAALGPASLVWASRAGTHSPGSRVHRLGNAVLRLAVRLAGGPRVGDSTSGFAALDARALSAFAADFPTDAADANLRVLAARKGLLVGEVPVHMPVRAGGTSMHQGWRSLRNGLQSLRAVARAARP